MRPNTGTVCPSSCIRPAGSRPADGFRSSETYASPMRVALVVNEASGGGTDPAPLERAMREHGAEVTTCGCEPDDLGTIPAAEPERVVVAGGDGTVGAVAELAGRLGVPLGVIPAGTANDFVRANDLPLDPVEAADVAIIPAGSRLGLARRAWGLKRHTIAEQRGVEHHRGDVIEVDVPPGTEFNADGEVRDRGLDRVTVERDAYALVA